MKFLAPIDVDGYVKADHLKISTTSVESVDVGEIVWNQIDGTFDMGLIGGVTLQSGQEMHIYGKASEAITNGDAIMFAGIQGDHILIAKAEPTAINANPEHFIGIATQDFNINQFGYTTVFGNVRTLDTSIYSLGTILYFASDIPVAGKLTTTMPVAPNAKIIVAAVLRVHANQGMLMVRPHVMPKIQNLQDVYAPSPNNSEVLYWNSNTLRYETSSISTVLGYIPANAGAVLYSSGTQTVYGTKIFNVSPRINSDLLLKTGGGFPNIAAGFTTMRGYSGAGVRGLQITDSTLVAGNPTATNLIMPSGMTTNYTFPSKSGTVALLDDIPTSGGGVVEILRNDLLTLKNNATLEPGTKYKITDSLQSYEFGLYSIPVIMTAATADSFELYSTGLFHNVKYNKYDPSWGIWNKIINARLVNFTGQGYFYNGETLVANTGGTGSYRGNMMIEYQSGTWVGATSVTGQWSGVTASISNYPWDPLTPPYYPIGSQVRYGNKIWENLTGNIGQDESWMYNYDNGFVLDSNWQVMTHESIPNLYNAVSDTVIYNIIDDMITYREDSQGNKVSESSNIIQQPMNKTRSNILKFQWGSFPEPGANYNYSCYDNVVGTDSVINNVNMAAGIFSNVLRGQSEIRGDYFRGRIYSNVLDNSMILENVAAQFSGNIERNQLYRGSQIYGNDMSSCQISQSILYGSSISQNSAVSQNFSIANCTFDGSSFGGNISKTGYYGLQNCRFYGSQVANNIFNNAGLYNNFFDVNTSVYNNAFTDSQFSDNTLRKTEMTNNTFISSGFMNNNTDFAYIQNNSCQYTQANNAGGIYNNTLRLALQVGWSEVRSRISYNSLSSSGANISSNDLGTGCGITDNSLAAYGVIMDNVLQQRGSITMNIVSNATIIQNTIIEGEITMNTLSSGTIASNRINGFYSGIKLCIMPNAINYIRYNTLNGYNSSIDNINFLSFFGVIEQNVLDSSRITTMSLNEASISQCELKGESVLTCSATISSKSIRRTTFEFVNTYSNFSNATIIFNEYLYKTVYQDDSYAGNTIRWFSGGQLNFNALTA